MSLTGFIRSNKGRKLSMIIGSSGVILPMGILYISMHFFSGNEPVFNSLNFFAIQLLFACSTLLGIVYIIRKEIITLFPIRGILAQLIGVVLVVLSLFFLVWTAYRMIRPI